MLLIARLSQNIGLYSDILWLMICETQKKETKKHVKLLTFDMGNYIYTESVIQFQCQVLSLVFAVKYQLELLQGTIKSTLVILGY